MTQTHRFPSAGQAIALLLAALGLAIALMYVLGWLTAALQIRLGASRGLVLGLIQLLALGPAIAWGWARTGLPFRDVFPLRPVRLSLLAPILLALMGITLVNGEVARMIRPLLPRWAGEFDAVTLLTQSPGNPWGFWVALVIVAPITEEFLFRGLILQGFLSRYSVRTSILISSILFGAIHLDLLKLLGTTAIGALFAWLFVRTRSLVPSLLGHALLNGWLVALLGIISTTIDPARLREVMSQGLDRPFSAATALVGVSFAGLGVSWLKRVLTHSEGGENGAMERPSGDVKPGRRHEGPPNGASSYPSILQAIWLLFLVVVLIFVLSVIAGAAAHVAGERPDHPAVAAAVNSIAIGVALAWGLRKTRAPAADVFPLSPRRIPLLLPLAVSIVGMVILISEVDNLLRTVLPVPPALADLFEQITGKGAGPWGLILAVVVAPLTEELLFRGLILRGFLRRYSVRTAIIASALLFGAFHLNPWQFLGAVALGVLFAWTFVRTGSLLLCIFGHALTNGLSSLIANVLHLEIPGFTSGLDRPEFQPLWFDALGVILTAAGVWLLMRAFSGIGARPQEAQAEPFPPSPT